MTNGFRLSEELGVATADLGAPEFLEALAARLAPESDPPPRAAAAVRDGREERWRARWVGMNECLY